MKKMILALCMTMGLNAPILADTLDDIIGTKFSNNKVSEAVISQDGTFYIVLRGKRYQGTWEGTADKYCRKIPALKVNGCQTIIGFHEGNVLTSVEFRNLGKKSGNRYQLN